jgi:acetolactate synthase-1/2/3 large subunit
LKTEEFAEIFEAALKAEKPTLIELKIDPEAITPISTLSEIRGSSS